MHTRHIKNIHQLTSSFMQQLISIKTLVIGVSIESAGAKH